MLKIEVDCIEMYCAQVTYRPAYADIDEAAKMMNERNIGALLVVDHEKLIGIITERDFLKLISE